MQTITKKSTSEFRSKGSKFIGYFLPVKNNDEVTSALESVQSEHPTATHHCYAYRLNPHKIEEFSQDDGEPGGTAGLPILNELKSADIINAILIVVRYYGGTKLGKPGLIDAYGETARVCIAKASLKKLIPVNLYKIEYAYQHQGIIDQLKNEITWFEKEATYMEHVSMTCGFPTIEIDLIENKLRSKEHLFINLEEMGHSFHIVT